MTEPVSAYFVGLVLGIIVALGATFVADIYIPDLLARRKPTVTVEDVRALTDRLSALTVRLGEEHHPAAQDAEDATLEALNLERKARGFLPLPKPVPLMPMTLFTLDAEPVGLRTVR
jgi:hypothetical protein